MWAPLLIVMKVLFVVSSATFFSNSEHKALNERVISEWWTGKDYEGSGCDLVYCTSIRLEGLRKTMKTLSQVSQSPGWDLNPGPPELEVGVLTIGPQHLVWETETITKVFREENMNIAYKTRNTIEFMLQTETKGITNIHNNSWILCL
jgi:hypothetical protein